jgi:putative membrane-bound dehydrogenase-like protein
MTSHCISIGDLRRCPLFLLTSLACVAFIVSEISLAEEPPKAVVEFVGGDFEGGAKDRYGSAYYGRTNLNYVYSKASNELASIQTKFRLESVPAGDLFLYVTGRNDDVPGDVAIAILVNGKPLHEGQSGFKEDDWETRRFDIPKDLLKVGTNEIAIKNLEANGAPGGPPWFMIADAAIAAAGYQPPDPSNPRERKFHVRPIDKIQSTGPTEVRAIGTAKTDITPTALAMLGGYAARKHSLTLEVNQPLFARALAIGSDEEGPAVLIAVDNLGVPTAIHKIVAEALEASHKIPRSRLTIASSHTHSAPILTGVAENITMRDFTPRERAAIDDYTKSLTDKLISVAREALKNRVSASLRRGGGTVKFAINRRGAGFVDHALPVLVVSDAEEKPLAVVANYACHCVSAGSGPLIGGDWAGAAAEAIESDMPGTVALITIGCGADQNPADVSGPNAAKRQGRLLADEVNRLLAAPVEPVVGKLTTSLEEIAIPFQSLPTKEKLLERSALAGIEGFAAKKLLARLERDGALADHLDYPVQTWAFGDDFAMVYLGGEVVVDYSLALKKRYDPARTWITAYANDAPCYIPSERVLREGGYEGGGAMQWYDKPTALAPGVERKILDEVDRQLGPKFVSDHDSSKTGGTRPLSAEKSIARMKVHEGYRVELVACEPLVVDPVAIDFGPDGKLWVAEMRDYPQGLDGKHSAGGKIKFLEDSDGDGKYDKSTTFLEEVPFPTGVTAWRNGVLICAAPDVIYAEDTDGDGKADVRRIVLAGFTTHNYQARVNSLALGLDNWIYGAAGIFGGNIAAPGRESVDVQNRDFRFHPDQGDIEAVSGRTQQGRARDDWGNWFGCENSTLLLHYPTTEHYYARNSNVSAPLSSVSSARSQQLFPSGKLVQFALSGPAGVPTSNCGLGIYRDTFLGDNFSNNSFSCEPVNQLVHRMMLQPNGVLFSGQRAAGEERSEFLSSTDNWFRPVQARTGPDGALWVVDMYRYVIEYPRFLSDDVKAKLDLRAGDTRGRIYRVLPIGQEGRKVPHVRDMGIAELVEVLNSPNGILRDLAHLELLWRNDKTQVSKIVELAQSSTLPQARLQAMCVLDGLGALNAAVIKRGLTDEHPGVRRHAVRLSEKFLNSSPGLGQALVALAKDADPQVRLQVAYSLGEWQEPRAGEALAAMVLASDGDPILQSAVFSGLNGKNIGSALRAITSSKDPNQALRSQVLALAIAVADKQTLPTVLEAALKPSGESYTAQEFQSFPGIYRELQRRGMNLQRDQDKSWERVLSEARKVLDGESAIELRVAAMGLLPLAAPNKSDLDRVMTFVSPQTDPELQRAALKSLASIPGQAAADAASEVVQTLSPTLQNVLIDEILARESMTSVFLSRIESGKIPRGLLGPAHRLSLLNHPKAEIQTRAKGLYAGSTSAETAALLASFKDLDPSGGVATEGQAVFTKHCAACHRVGEIGHKVGPDLLSLTDKSPDYMLKSIVDPNAAVDQRYATYMLATDDGRILTGILASESVNEVVIKEKEGKEHAIRRKEIEEFRNTGLSMMPDGLAKEFKRADMQNLLAFLGAADAASGPESVRELRKLTSELKVGTPDEYKAIPAIFTVTLAAGRRNEAAELRAILEVAMPQAEAPLHDWQAVAVGGGVVNGISQSGPWPAARVLEIIGEDRELSVRWKRVLELAAKMADDEKVNSGTRYDALRIVACRDFKDARGQLTGYLNQPDNRDLQQGAVSGLADCPHEDAAVALAKATPKLHKDLQGFAIAGLIRVDGETNYLLSAIKNSKIRVDAIPSSVTSPLLAHPNEAIRLQAEKLLGR